MIPWYRSKTIWFNLLVAVIAIASLFGFADFKPTDNVIESIGVLVALVNIFLRFISQRQIGKFPPTG
jgi:hypothetical protein